MVASPLRLLLALLGVAVVVTVLASTALAAGTSGTAHRTGTGSLQNATAAGSDTFLRGQRELKGPKRPGTNPLRRDPLSGGVDLAGRPGAGAKVSGTKKAKANVGLITDWHGLDHRATRTADGGNQYSGEPPDQGLCVGNGYVFESVNQAVRVYDTSGAPVSGVVSLNDFYGYPPAIVRTAPPTFPGPFIFDPECHYDPASQRWYHIVASIEQDPVTGGNPGYNALLLAVSQTSSPLGAWNIYEIPGVNNGDFETPDHECGPEPGDPCFADFPHLAVDAYGVYITENEFSFFGSGVTGAQIYAFSKAALASGAADVPFTLINTGDFPVSPEEPFGFTLWPAKSAGTEFDLRAGGTQYFLSSNAIFDDINGDSDEIHVWALTNTSSLNSATPALDLKRTTVDVTRYAVPVNATQKPGPFPLGQCINDTTLPTPFGTGCWNMLFVTEPAHNETLQTIDSGDSRFLDARYANGKLWGVLGTQVNVGDPAVSRTGVGWYILKPEVSPTSLTAKLHLEGVLADPTTNFTYPALGVSNSGRGVLVFSHMSENYHPSAGYAPIDAKVGVGNWNSYELGLSPQDGFAGYKAFGEPTRPRWGDYSGAAVDGDTVYVATEYIGVPPCHLAPSFGPAPWYYPFPGTGAEAFAGFGSCLVGNPIPSQARTSLANWGTRIGKFTTK